MQAMDVVIVATLVMIHLGAAEGHRTDPERRGQEVEIGIETEIGIKAMVNPLVGVGVEIGDNYIYTKYYFSDSATYYALAMFCTL